MKIRSLAEMSVSAFVPADVCIVGAGMAGLFMAYQLSKHGLRVVVAESGRKASDRDAGDLNEVCDDDKLYRWPVSGRVRGLGGSSVAWGGKMIPLAANDVTERAHIAAEQWPLSHAELLEGIDEVESLFRLDGGTYEEDADIDGRFGPALPRNDTDFTVRWAKWAGFKRGNVWGILLPRLEQTSNLEIWLDSTACSFTVDPESGRMRSVQCRNQAGMHLVISATHFVVAAGTIESTRLLLLLDEMQRGQIFRNCDALGRYFQDHLDAKVGRLIPTNSAAVNKLFSPHYIRRHRRTPHLEMTASAQYEERVASAFVHVTADVSQNPTLAIVKQAMMAIEGGHYSAALAEFANGAINFPLLGKLLLWRTWHRTLLLPPDVDLNLRVCAEQMPDRENRISLAEECDRLGMKKVSLRWRPSDADERTFSACIRRFKSFWTRNGLDRVCRIDWTPSTQGPAGSLLAEAQDYAHPAGTTRMGTQKTTSVVRPDLVCHAMGNLSVVSASCFPSTGSANPTLTIMLLAWRAAAAIRRLLSEPVVATSQAVPKISGGSNA